VDIRSKTGQCAIEQCFGNLPEGQWLAANAYKYGFLLRYPEDKESITGYEYEPWHYRYIGTALSHELHRTRTQTLEEFFGVSGGKSYN
jgi:D-alanyl-D-alanine carboxypeptidase